MDETVTLTVTEMQAMFLLKMIEPTAVLRVTWTSLFQAMRDKGWI